MKRRIVFHTANLSQAPDGFHYVVWQGVWCFSFMENCDFYEVMQEVKLFDLAEDHFSTRAKPD